VLFSQMWPMRFFKFHLKSTTIWHICLRGGCHPFRICNTLYPIFRLSTQVMRWPNARKLGVHINIPSKSVFLDISHTGHSKFSWVLVKCFRKEILCTHTEFKQLEGTLPISATAPWLYFLIFISRVCNYKSCTDATTACVLSIDPSCDWQ